MPKFLAKMDLTDCKTYPALNFDDGFEFGDLKNPYDRTQVIEKYRPPTNLYSPGKSRKILNKMSLLMEIFYDSEVAGYQNLQQRMIPF